MKAKRYAAAIAAMLAVFSLTACFAEKEQQPTQSSTAATAFTTKPGNTTVKPFVEAKTEIIGGLTTAAPTAPTHTARPTKEHTEVLVKQNNAWPTHPLFNSLPKVKTSKIKQATQYKTEQGTRYIVTLDNFSYTDFLAYIKQVEAAGFSDNNNRANIPASPPADVAMFYSAFDGKRSFGIYWQGSQSKADFDCIIVVCNYDQADEQ